ncbi:MAG: hypothetical protein ACLP50_38000 [Solirubrobacteraceae bacterium]
MRTSAVWMRDAPVLACLSGLGHKQALQRLRRDPAAIAAMYASAQWTDAQRWAERWAGSDRAYERALVCGFAAQYDVQAGVLSVGAAEQWALPPAVRRVSYWDGRAGTPIVGADLGTAAFASAWVEGWMSDLERHILPAAPTDAASEILATTGVALLTWLGNHVSRLPEGVGGPDAALRGVRRAWPEIAATGVSRVQTDSVRRLYLGSCANGYQSGRTVGVVQWIARGRSIEQARAVPALATSWAVAVDQADPTIARLSREALKRRQKTVRGKALRRLAPNVEAQLSLDVQRAGPRRAAAA